MMASNPFDSFQQSESPPTNKVGTQMHNPFETFLAPDPEGITSWSQGQNQPIVPDQHQQSYNQFGYSSDPFSAAQPPFNSGYDPKEGSLGTPENQGSSWSPYNPADYNGNNHLNTNNPHSEYDPNEADDKMISIDDNKCYADFQRERYVMRGKFEDESMSK